MPSDLHGPGYRSTLRASILRGAMPSVLSVNVGRERPNPFKDVGVTGIDKRPTDGPVEVRAPGPKDSGRGSGLVGDAVCDRRHHGGDDQAVYAYAREDLDAWSATLGRPLANGAFGENLTTSGLDINEARIGERWRIGQRVVLEVANRRLPCATFAGWIAERGWARTFTRRALPGAYLRVIEPGHIRSGDALEVVHRPDHDVTIQLVFRATTLEPDLLPRLLVADALTESTMEDVRRRLGSHPG
jgi:MOSC domain-containing protein YiiM